MNSPVKTKHLESKRKDREALEGYKQSFLSNSNQNEVLIKIGELLIKQDFETNTNEMKYWAKHLAERFPRHQITSKLMKKLLETMKNELSQGSSLYESAESSLSNRSSKPTTNHSKTSVNSFSDAVQSRNSHSGQKLLGKSNNLLKTDHIYTDMNFEMEQLVVKQNKILENILHQQQSLLDRNKQLQELLNELKALVDLKLEKRKENSSEATTVSQGNSQRLQMNQPSRDNPHLHQFHPQNLFYPNYYFALPPPFNPQSHYQPPRPYQSFVNPFNSKKQIPLSSETTRGLPGRNDQSDIKDPFKNITICSPSGRIVKNPSIFDNAGKVYGKNYPPFLFKANANENNEPSPIIASSNGFFDSNTPQNSPATVFKPFQNSYNWSSSGSGNLNSDIFNRDASFSTLNAQSGSFSFQNNPKAGFLGNESQVFGRKASTETSNALGNHEDSRIPLPNVSKGKTAEESEILMFSQRGRCSRFDLKSKEWEEGGAGDLRILFHPHYKTYRLVFGSEQPATVLCNVFITLQTDFRPLKLSPSNSWMWAGLNFIYENPQVEILAVKLRNKDLAEEFKKIVDKAKEELKKLPAKEDPNLTEVSLLNCLDDVDQHYSLVLEKQVAFESLDERHVPQPLGNGFLKIIYDLDALIVRIVFDNPDTGVTCDTLVCMESKIQVEGLACTYSAINDFDGFSLMKRCRVTFATTEDVNEMLLNFQEAQEFAKHAYITENAFYEDYSLPKS